MMLAGLPVLAAYMQCQMSAQSIDTENGIESLPTKEQKEQFRKMPR